MGKLSRRSFIATTGTVAAGALVLPGITGCKNNRNGKVNLAIIGVGGRGKAGWSACMDENIVALCDVNMTAAAEGFSTFPEARRFKDFRRMFDKMARKIDAVIISTPDHTHFAAAMAAMEWGKHVLVEKPLAHNIWQLRTLRKAAKKYKVITQMGNQGHTTNGIRQVKEWYDAGILGEVKEVLPGSTDLSLKKQDTFLNLILILLRKNLSRKDLTGISGWGRLPTGHTTGIMFRVSGEAGMN